MKKRLDITIGQQLALGFGAAGLLLVIMLGSILLLGARVDAMRDRYVGFVAPKAQAVDLLETSILYVSIKARAYHLDPDAASLPRPAMTSAGATESPLQRSGMMRLVVVACGVVCSLSCAQTVRLKPQAVASVCPEPCQTPPDEVYGMAWQHINVEKTNGETQVLDRGAVDAAALRAPDAECIEFVRPTTGRFWAGTGIGCVVGFLASGLAIGLPLEEPGGPTPGVGIAVMGALGCLVAGPIGGLVNHHLASPDDYPDNRCHHAPSPPPPAPRRQDL